MYIQRHLVRSLRLGACAVLDRHYTGVCHAVIGLHGDLGRAGLYGGHQTVFIDSRHGGLVALPGQIRRRVLRQRRAQLNARARGKGHLVRSDRHLVRRFSHRYFAAIRLAIGGRHGDLGCAGAHRGNLAGVIHLGHRGLIALPGEHRRRLLRQRRLQLKGIARAEGGFMYIQSHLVRGLGLRTLRLLDRHAQRRRLLVVGLHDDDRFTRLDTGDQTSFRHHGDLAVLAGVGEGGHCAIGQRGHDLIGAVDAQLDAAGIQRHAVRRVDDRHGAFGDRLLAHHALDLCLALCLGRDDATLVHRGHLGLAGRIGDRFALRHLGGIKGIGLLLAQRQLGRHARLRGVVQARFAAFLGGGRRFPDEIKLSQIVDNRQRQVDIIQSLRQIQVVHVDSRRVGQLHRRDILCLRHHNFFRQYSRQH